MLRRLSLASAIVFLATVAGVAQTPVVHTFIPELATAVEQLDEATVATCAAEKRSKVSFDLEPEGDQVKLTVIHDDFGPDSTVLGMISGGWPWKLSNLKTALEQS